MNEIEAERRRRGWSTSDLSRHAGVHERTVRRAEAGEPVSWPMRRRLLDAMALPVHLGEPPSEERLARSVRAVMASEKDPVISRLDAWIPFSMAAILAVWAPSVFVANLEGARDHVVTDITLMILFVLQIWAWTGSNRCKLTNARRELMPDAWVVLQGMAHGDPHRVPRDVVAKVARIVGLRNVIAYANAVGQPATNVEVKASQKEVAALSGVSTRTLRRMDGGKDVSEETRRRVEAARASLRPAKIAVPRDDHFVEALVLLNPDEDVSPVKVVDRLAARWLPVVVLGAAAFAWGAWSLVVQSPSTDFGIALGAISIMLVTAAARGWSTRQTETGSKIRSEEAATVVDEGIRSGALRYTPEWLSGTGAVVTPRP